MPICSHSGAVGLSVFCRTLAAAFPDDQTLIVHLACFAALVRVVEGVIVHGRGRSNPELLRQHVRTYLELYKGLYGEKEMIFKSCFRSRERSSCFDVGYSRSWTTVF
jgi:hypothetical protein